MKYPFLFFTITYLIYLTSCSDKKANLETQFYASSNSDTKNFFLEKRLTQNNSDTPVKNLHSFDFSTWIKTNYKSGDIINTRKIISFYDSSKNNSLQVKNTGDNDAYFFIYQNTSNTNKITTSDIYYLKANESYTVKNIPDGEFYVQGYSGKNLMKKEFSYKKHCFFRKVFKNDRTYFLDTRHQCFTENDFKTIDIKDAVISKTTFNYLAKSSITLYEDEYGKPLSQEQIIDYRNNVFNNSKYTEKVIMNNEMVECVIVSYTNKLPAIIYTS